MPKTLKFFNLVDFVNDLLAYPCDPKSRKAMIFCCQNGTFHSIYG